MRGGNATKENYSGLTRRSILRKRIFPSLLLVVVVVFSCTRSAVVSDGDRVTGSTFIGRCDEMYVSSPNFCGLGLLSCTFSAVRVSCPGNRYRFTSHGGYDGQGSGLAWNYDRIIEGYINYYGTLAVRRQAGPLSVVTH